MKKKQMRQGAAAVLALTLVVGCTGGALGYTTADYTDVPASHWAYKPVMEMADAGIINGVGGGAFAPDTKLSAAMFLTLVGRALYAEEVAAEGAANWYAPWVEAAEGKGLLTGSGISTAAIEAEISRYDMAVVLRNAARDVLGRSDATADTGKIVDYGMVPVMYADAVAQVFAQGLITGDQHGNFNGTAAMSRAEAATVISRLLDMKNSAPEQPEQPEEPDQKPEEDIPPRTGETKTFTVKGKVTFGRGTHDPVEGVDLVFCYMDGRELARTVSGKDGYYEMEVTVDMADYSWTESVYNMKATYTAPDGTKYSNLLEDGSFWTSNDNLATSAWSWGIDIDNNEYSYKDF